MDDDIAEIAASLRYDQGTNVELAERTIRLLDEVKGDPGLSVLRVLSLAQAASPVGAAAHGPSGVAAGVWRAPDLYLARWTRGRRWVVGYRLTGGSRLSDYVGMEGRPPTRFEVGNWYTAHLPDEVTEAFLEAGLLVDDPPFPVAEPDPEPASLPSRTPVSRSAPARPSTRAARAPAVAKAQPAPTSRLCPGCRMHKAVGQFVAGSDRCVDCREEAS